MKKIDTEGLWSINEYIVKKAIRNKIFQYGTFEKYVIAAIDGTQILDSKKKKCESCLTMNKRGVAHYTHNAAVMSTIGNVPNMQWSVPFVKDSSGFYFQLDKYQ